MLLTRRRRRKLEIAVVVILLVAAGMLSIKLFHMNGATGLTTTVTEGLKEVSTLTTQGDPLSLDDFTRVKLGVTPGKIFLVDNCTGMVIRTSMSKTLTIQRGMDHSYDFRPDVYDTAYDIMENYGILPQYVKITKGRDDVYYAQLLMGKENKLLDIDTKPSDALAIAARFSVPVYVQTDAL